MNILIIDFANKSINAGVFSSRIEPVEFFTAPVDKDLKSALSSIMQGVLEKYKDFSKVVASIPPHHMSMRIVSLPFYDKKKTEDILAFEIGDLLHKKMDDMLIEAIPLADNKILAVAVEKKTIQEYLNLLKGFDIDPVWIGSSLFSMDWLLKEAAKGDDVLTLINDESIVVSKNGRPYLFKVLKDDADLNLIFANLYEEGIDIKTAYMIGRLDDKLHTVLMGKGIKTIPLFLHEHKFEQVLNKHPAAAGVAALSLHLKDNLKGAANFRKGGFAYTIEDGKRKKGFITASILFAALICLWGLHIYLKYKIIDTEMSKMKDNLNASYRGLFPKEPVVDALHQMEAKVKALKDEKQVVTATIKALDAMKGLSNSAGSNANVRLYELHMDDGKISAKGEAVSFEAVNNFKDTIAKLPYFKDVLLRDVKTGAGGKVIFNLSIAHKNT